VRRNVYAKLHITVPSHLRSFYHFEHKRARTSGVAKHTILNLLCVLRIPRPTTIMRESAASEFAVLSDGSGNLRSCFGH
jgi:hypothetical protein